MVSGRQLRAGRVFVEFGGNDTALQRVMRRVAQRVSGFGRSLAGLGTRLTALSGAITAPLAAATGIFARTGDQLDKLSRRTGFTVEALSTLGFAAQQSGASIETLQRAAKGQANAIQELGRGSATYIDTFDALGLTFEQISQLSPEQQFKLIADRLAGVENFGERAALAMDIFGRSGQELLPLLESGSKGIEELQQRARDLELEIDTEAAKQAAELTDRLNELKRVALNIAFRIGQALGGTTADIAKRFAEIGARVTRFVKANKDLIVAVAKTAAIIGAVGVALLTIGGLFIFVGAAISGLVTVIGVASTVFGGLVAIVGAILSPIGLVVAAVVGLGVAIGTTTGVFKKIGQVIRAAFGSIAGTAIKAFEGIKNALAGGDIQLAVRIAWLAIQVEFQRGVAYVQGLWLNLKQFLVDQFASTMEVIEGLWKALVDFFGPSITAAVDGIGNAIGRIKDFLAPVVEFLRNAWRNLTTFIVEAFNSAFGSVGDDGFDLGRSLIEIAIGVKGAWASATTAISKFLTGALAKTETLRQRAAGFVADRLLEAQGLIDPNFDVEEAKRIRKEITDSDVANIKGQAEDDIAKLDADLKKRETDLGQQLIDFDKRVKERKEKAQSDIEREAAGVGDRVKAAEDKLAAALEQAANAAEQQQEAVEEVASRYADLPTPQGLTGAISQGLFNTSGIRSLLGSPALDKQTKLSEKQLATQKALLRTLSQRQRVAVWAN